MTDTRRNYLKECREFAKLTQEQAAPLLGISPRTLSDYENDHCPVPLDIIDNMAVFYKTPLVARWYVKYRTVIGKYMPDVYDIKTEGDMFLQSVMAQDNLNCAVEGIKQLLRNDGKITANEILPLCEHISQCKDAITNATSVVCYAEQIVARTVA